MPERLKHQIERSRNNPYEWSFCVGLLLLSLYGLVFSPASGTLDRSLSTLMLLTYSAVGLLGALFTLVGLRLRDPHAGLLAERIGQVGTAGGALTFFIVIYVFSDFREAGLVGMSALAICGGAGGRVVQITRDLRRERHLLDVALRIQDHEKNLENTIQKITRDVEGTCEGDAP